MNSGILLNCPSSSEWMNGGFMCPMFQTGCHLPTENVVTSSGTAEKPGELLQNTPMVSVLSLLPFSTFNFPLYNLASTQHSSESRYKNKIISSKNDTSSSQSIAQSTKQYTKKRQKKTSLRNGGLRATSTSDCDAFVATRQKTSEYCSSSFQKPLRNEDFISSSSSSDAKIQSIVCTTSSSSSAEEHKDEPSISDGDTNQTKWTQLFTSRKRTLSWPIACRSTQKKQKHGNKEKIYENYENIEIDVARILVSDIPFPVFSNKLNVHVSTAKPCGIRSVNERKNTSPVSSKGGRGEVTVSHWSPLIHNTTDINSHDARRKNEIGKKLDNEEREVTREYQDSEHEESGCGNEDHSENERSPRVIMKLASTEDLISHEKRHVSNTFIWKCHVCTQVFRSINGLQKHIEFHADHEKNIQCSFCFKSFLERENLDEHIISCRMSRRPHKCLYCPKAFRDPGSLQKHIRIHTGERPYKCRACEKSFAEYSSLRKHNRVHTGEQPYKCMYCDKAFSISGNLQRHILIHTGERPYKCSVCPKTFNNPSHLRRHEKNLHSKLDREK